MGDSVIAGPFPTSSLFSGTKSKIAVTAGPGGPAITLFFKKKIMMVPLLRFRVENFVQTEIFSWGQFATQQRDQIRNKPQ
jgi:hypothetical protein